jgi:leader peptidase (prepilin peptidase)/N-methyltransferase
MVKELAFLAPCGLMAWLGGSIGVAVAPRVGEILTISGGAIPTATLPPLWLNVLAGVLLGYLVGGGLVWLVRILGSIGFNKEAMGLGDVHLLAAVGATLGWIDAVLTFFTAAFVGLAWTLIAAVASGSGPRRTLPFGPSLAIASVIVTLAKPLFEWFLGRIMHTDGPLNLP